MYMDMRSKTVLCAPLDLSGLFANHSMERCPYPYEGERQRGRSEHRGQAKLFISEVYMLTRFLQDHPGFCLYVGASPGSNRNTSHLSELTENFPHVKWLLVDPSFSENFTMGRLKQTNYRIYRRFFDDDMASAVRDFFIGKPNDHEIVNVLKEFDLSDTEKMNFIHFNDMRQEAYSEECVLEDMINQMKWSKIMKPLGSMLKFRPPYYFVKRSRNEGRITLHDLERKYNDVIQVKDGRFVMKYVAGDIMLPIYGCLNTTECRLIVQDHDKSQYHDILFHEETMCAFNNITRIRDNFDDRAYELVVDFFRNNMPRGRVFHDYCATSARKRNRQVYSDHA